MSEPCSRLRQIASAVGAAHDNAAVDADGAPLSLLLWEIRGRVKTDRTPRAVIDGGARAEWSGPHAGAAGSFRFAVGSPPSGLRALVRDGRPPGDAGPDRWSDWVQHVANELCAAVAGAKDGLRELERIAESERLVGCAARAEIHVRLRGWQRAGELPRAERSVGARVALRHETSGGDVWEWSGPDLTRAPWMRGPGSHLVGDACRRFAAAHARRGDRGGALPASYCGPALVLPAAAGWWAHEMAHAAIEAPHLPSEGDHGLRIVDDPDSGPWPAGFAWDDTGEPATRVVLWGSGCRDGAVATGRRRRATIRDEARATPTVTRCQIDRHDPETTIPLIDGAPVLAGVRAGRFDPISGVIHLDVDRLGVVVSGGWQPIPGRRLVAVRPDEGWSGVRAIVMANRFDEIAATCTRLGQMNAVMVGAPTVVLDPVRF